MLCRWLLSALNRLQGEDKHMDLDHAIEAHAQWKIKFRMAIDTKQSMDAVSIGQDNCCELGKWLHGDAQASFGARPELASLVEKHKAFHAEAGRVATAINSGKYDEADKMIGAGTPFSHSSLEVGVAVRALKKALESSAAA
jgi:Chemoreceptor zinc-binding domain